MSDVTEETTPRPTRKRRAFSVAQLMAERRRSVISFTVGLIVLLLVQIPAVEQSFLGAPDRQMLEMAFKLRGDLIHGAADPILFLDIDDRTLSQLSPHPGSFAPPLQTTPRKLLANLLDFIRTAPPGQAPRAVVMDVDIGNPAPDGDAAVASLLAALKAWSASPSSPPLIIVRESFTAATLGLDTPARILPDTPYDAVVQPAPNIFWATPSVLGDMNGEIREFVPFQCVLTSAGMKPLYSAALVGYQFIERDPNILLHAPSRHWLQDGTARCRNNPYQPLQHGERIDFHFSMDHAFSTRAWPSVAADWPGYKTCHDTDSSIFMRLSAIDIDSAFRAGGDVSRGLLCQHVVYIGGTNSSGADFVQTPISEMNGAAVLANALRGLQLTHGGMRAIPLIWQVLLLLLVSLAMSATSLVSSRARCRFRRLKQSTEKHGLRHRLEINLLNPIVLNGMIALAAHGLGIALLLVSLNFGLWGFLSAPVFASAITETIQEFADG